MKAVVVSLVHQGALRDAFAEVTDFRAELYACPTARGDASTAASIRDRSTLPGCVACWPRCRYPGRRTVGSCWPARLELDHAVAAKP